MSLTRRQAMAAMAAMPAGAARLAAQSRGPGAMLPRVTPAVCLYSRVLIEIGQVDLPMVIGGLGFDGVDLSVEPGGHVPPEKAGNYLMPALEGFTGRGIDVPMITTALTSLEDKDAETILGLATYIKVPFFRPGHWKFTGSPAIEMQLPLVQRQIAGLAQLARATNMVMGIHNFVDGAEGAAVPDIARVIRPINPHLVGYCFDAGYATAQGGPNGFAAALELALPITSRSPRPRPSGKIWPSSASRSTRPTAPASSWERFSSSVAEGLRPAKFHEKVGEPGCCRAGWAAPEAG